MTIKTKVRRDGDKWAVLAYNESDVMWHQQRLYTTRAEVREWAAEISGRAGGMSNVYPCKEMGR